MNVALAHMYTFRVLRGIERYVINLANALAASGTGVTVVTGRTVRPQSADPLDPRIAVHGVRHLGWSKASFVPGFALDFLRYRYDAIGLMMARGEGWAAAVAGLFRRLPLNIIFHIPASGRWGRREYATFARLGLTRRATRLIAVSEYVARDVERWFGRRADVIPNGVNAAKFRYDPAARAEVRAELGVGDRDRVIVTVGSIEPRKGVQDVVAALPRLASRSGDRRLVYVVVGDGTAEQRAALAAATRRAGLSETVRLVGFHLAPERYYSAADAFALLARDEAFGIVVLEALACGLPVVVTDGSAFPEIVPPGAGRLVARPDDPDQVADALGAVLAAGRPGEAARRPVVDRYSWHAVASRYLDAVGGRLAVPAGGGA